MDTLFTLADETGDTTDVAKIKAKLAETLEAFNEVRRLAVPQWEDKNTLLPVYLTPRQILRKFIDRFRLVGQEVILWLDLQLA